jgi:hypothetical protein
MARRGTASNLSRRYNIFLRGDLETEFRGPCVVRIEKADSRKEKGAARSPPPCFTAASIVLVEVTIVANATTARERRIVLIHW